MILEGTNQLSYFPLHYALSKYYSPNMIVSKKRLDYKQHCQHAVRSTIQANNEPRQKNSSMARTVGCIYFRPNTSIYGGHEPLHLPTNKVIRRFTLQTHR